MKRKPLPVQANATQFLILFEASSKTGVTSCYILAHENVVSSGTATCSLKTYFDPAVGKKIALGRAIKTLYRDLEEIVVQKPGEDAYSYWRRSEETKLKRGALWEAIFDYKRMTVDPRHYVPYMV